MIPDTKHFTVDPDDDMEIQAVKIINTVLENLKNSAPDKEEAAHRVAKYMHDKWELI